MSETNPLKQLQDDFGQIPHSLQLCDIIKVKDEKCMSILKRLKTEKDLFCDEEDITRNENFTSVLLFRLNHRNEAFEINKSVLEKCPQNVTALVNQICMKMADGYEKEATDLLLNLKTLWNQDHNEFFRATAVADEAYALSRISPKFYLRSIALSETVIQKFPGKMLWKFGCALMYKRCLGMPKCIDGLSEKELTNFCDKALSYFFEVANKGTVRLRAQSWTFLGEVKSTLRNPVYPLTPTIVNSVRMECRLSAEECFENALRMEESKEDVIVLQRCGNSLRFANSGSYVNRLKESYRLLLMAYNIKHTSYVCDKLATVLMKMVETGIEPDDRPVLLGPRYKFDQRGRRGGRNQRMRGQHFKSNNRVRENCNSEYDFGYQPHDFSANPRNFSELSGNRYTVEFNSRGQKRHFPRNKGRYISRGQKVLECQTPTPRETKLNPFATSFVPATLCPSDDDTSCTGAVGGEGSLNTSMEQMKISPEKKMSHKSKTKFKQTIDSPKKVELYHSSNPWLNKAVGYLKESIDFTEECNKIAIYKLGLLYRRLQRLDDAIATFRSIYSDSESSLYDKVNAYEQAGFCHLDKSEDPNLSSDERYEEKENSKYMMKRAVEEAARLVASMPTMNQEDLDSWDSYPTLKQLLCSEARRDHTKYVALLCELIGNYKESLEWYEELRKINPNDIEALYKIIVTHMHLEQFQSAQESLNIMLCSSEGKKLREHHPQLFYQVYLGTVKHLMLSNNCENDNDLLKTSCKSAFEYKYGRSQEQDTENYDVFILDDPEKTETKAAALKTWLMDACGLSVTRNDEDVAFGCITLEAQAELIHNAKCVVIVLGSTDTNLKIKSLIGIMFGTKGSESVVPVMTPGASPPVLLSGCRPIETSKDEKGNLTQRFLCQCFVSMLGHDFDTFTWL